MKKRLLVFAVGLVVATLALWGFASIDRCGTWPHQPAALTVVTQSQGELKVGAAKVPYALHFPMTVGGYPPPRATADASLTPLNARALVLDVGGQKLALVLLDALLIPPQLRDAIIEGQPAPTWVIATHTHSGPSGFDRRLSSELAALGTFSKEDEAALITAARTALTEATAKLAPAKYTLGEFRSEGISVARSGPDVDRRITRLLFEGVAQVLIVSAHPTLVARKPAGLHADWPGLLADRLEQDGGPITLVVQGAAGNASIDRDALPTPEAAAERLATLVGSMPMAPQPEPIDAAWSEAKVSLMRPDAHRAVPGFLTAAAENALCDAAEDIAVLHGLRLGDARLVTVPVEPSLQAGLVLEEQARASRLVSLTDGYAGYVETMESARLDVGEAHRQYFPPELLSRLAEGAALIGEALKPAKR